MAITDYPVVLPVVFSHVHSGITLQTKLILVVPSQGFSDVVETLSDMAGDYITFFIKRSTKERVQMVVHSNLTRQRAVCLHVIVGLPQEACKVCNNALNHGLISEFHFCVEDKTILGRQWGQFRCRQHRPWSSDFV